MSDYGRMIFLNLAVKDLERAKAFFGGLGFQFNPQFTDQNAACMIVNPTSFVMLLAEPFFRGFTTREPSDPHRQTEVMIALSASSRAAVDELVHKAVALGGTHAMPAQDHGFMYGWSFYDPDGHHWEVAWMDPAAVSG